MKKGNIKQEKTRLNPGKMFVSDNGLYDIVVCHNATDAQLYIDGHDYQYPSWCYVTSQASFLKYTSHSVPLGAKGGVMIMFFRKDSNSVQKTKGLSSSHPLLCDEYAISVFSLTTDYRKEDGALFVRSLTNRYNKTNDIYAHSKDTAKEAEEVRKGLEEFSRLTGMDVAAFAIVHTPPVLDKQDDSADGLFEEIYNDGHLSLNLPTLNIPKNKKTVLCKIKDHDGDDQLYDLQPCGALRPHGMRKLCNELIQTFPPEAMDVLRKILPAYASKYKDKE
jgi:hypothetical protein